MKSAGYRVMVDYDNALVAAPDLTLARADWRPILRRGARSRCALIPRRCPTLSAKHRRSRPLHMQESQAIFHLMQPSLTPLAPAVDERRVLTEAVRRLAEEWSLSHKELSVVLGVSEASLSRLGRSRTIDPKSKEGELALLLLRIFRSLDALVGGSSEKAGLWLRAENAHLVGIPLSLLKRVDGLVHVAEYLDALRGRV